MGGRKYPNGQTGCFSAQNAHSIVISCCPVSGSFVPTITRRTKSTASSRVRWETCASSRTRCLCAGAASVSSGCCSSSASKPRIRFSALFISSPNARPGIHAERRRKMVRFQICCLHHLHLLFPVDLCSYYKGNRTEYGCENLCCRSKSRVVYYNPKISSYFTTFHPYCLRFSCYTLGKKIRGLRTALKRKEGITEWTLKRSSSR